MKFAEQCRDQIYRYPYRFFLLLFLVAAAIYQFWPEGLEVRDARGRTPLYLAAEQGELAAVKRLLQRGAQVDGCDDCRWTPLMRAAQNGHREIVELLLAHGADVNARDKGGYSALMVAAGDNRAEIVSLLLRHGALPNLQDESMGWTALIWAAKEGYGESVAALLAGGADKGVAARSGKRAIDWAREAGHDDVVRQLEASSH